MIGRLSNPFLCMLVMLAYDVPEQRHQNRLRKEFERLGAQRVQYSIYLFAGELHECDRIIRYMRRVACDIPGDIRLFPMEEAVWDAQIIIAECLENTERIAELKEFVKIW
jgi:CRISPR-associated endonuclease Cas2